MKRIAVVEDNEDSRLLVQALLEDRYAITLYAGGAEALDGMEQAKPDLVLLDISLPGMDGKEVLRRIRASAALCDLPVIALTAHAMAGDREECLRSGFDGYLSKPIEDERRLVEAVERHLAR